MLYAMGFSPELVSSLIFALLSLITIGIPLWYYGSALVSGYITRWEKIHVPLHKYLVECTINREDMERWDEEEWLMNLCIVQMFGGSVVAIPLSLGLGFAITYLPFWALVTIGSTFGVLTVARFAYGLHSRYEKHLKDLHNK